MNAGRISRRSFLQTSAATGAAATFSAPNIFWGRNLNERLNIAMVGLGNRGQRNTGYFEAENIVALCDVNMEKLGLAAKFYPKARRATDFRRLFDHLLRRTLLSSPSINRAVASVATAIILTAYSLGP